MAGFIRLLKQKWYPPAPVTDTTAFTGKTVLITGATTGLGLEAAKKIALLGPKVLIITARDEGRGARARDVIERFVLDNKGGGEGKVRVEIMMLDMVDLNGVVGFVDEVERRFPALDVVILNAGCVTKEWRGVKVGSSTIRDGGSGDAASGKGEADEWDEAIVVNCLGTTLLALLLLPVLMKNGSESKKPRLEIVTSGLAKIQTAVSMKVFTDDENPLARLNDKAITAPTGSMGESQKRYARSKVCMEVNMRYIAKLPVILGDDGKPKVLVNSTCPGLCSSDLGREMGDGMMLKIAMGMFFTLFGRTSEQGSNSLVSGVTRGVEGHGMMWKDDQDMDAGEFLESDEGKVFGEKVWKETCHVLMEVSPRVKDVL